MTKRINALLVLLFCVTFAFAQSGSDVPSYESTTGFQKDGEKAGEEEKYFPPKPKHGTEIGISGGHLFLHSDVYALPGWHVGLHVRRAINYVVSWRVQGTFGISKGLDDRISTLGSDEHGNSGLIVPQRTWGTGTNGYGYPTGSEFYRNHKTKLGQGSFQFVVNMSNILFHKPQNKWNLYVFAGPTLLYHKTHVNILNGDNVYTNNAGQPGMQVQPGTPAGEEEFWDRSVIKEIKNNLLDNSYETAVPYGEGSDGNVAGWSNFNLGGNENFSLMPAVDFGAGLAMKLTPQLNLALEHQALISLNDNIDGYTSGRNVDVPHYTSLHLNFNINPKEGVEPLYWVNPLDNPMKDLAEVKKKIYTVKDTDGDGVIDELDEEPDTPEGAPVNTKGQHLDSDGDGIFDLDDEERYTPAYIVAGAKNPEGDYEIDSQGRAVVKEKECCITDQDIVAIGKREKWDEKPVIPTPAPAMTDWFLPMIHFDLNKHNLKPESKAQLHHIARVMKRYPSLCVVAVGHTDRLNNNAYNQKLSYNRAQTAVDYLVQVYGIDRSRLVVNYGGEETPLVDTNASSYINRRVEFRICNGERDMGAPDGSTPVNNNFGSDSSSPSTPNSGTSFGNSGNAPIKY